MEIFSIALFAIVCAVLVLTLKNTRPEYALLLSIAAGCVILALTLKYLAGIFHVIEEMFSGVGINSEYFVILLKALGICYIAQFAGEVCKDFGQASLSSKIELGGKIAVLLLCLPLIKTVIETATKLIG